MAPITLNGTASSSLPISYSVISGPATVNLATLTITGAGVVSIQATQSGNGSFAPATPVTVTFTVNRATPTITTLPTASAITFGQTLASSTLIGGTGSTAGSFAFTTPASTPGAGTAPQSVVFTPTDMADYNTATGSISVTVNKAIPAITTLPTASTITYGQTLAVSTLSGGAASTTGSFAFTSPATVPGAGTPSESVTFTPSDLTDYTTATQTVSLTVTQATAVVTLGSLNQTYNGAPEPVTVSTSPTGLFLTYSYTGINGTIYSSSATPPTNPGSYSVAASVVDPNYIGQDIETLTINQLSPALSFTLMSGAPVTTPYGTTVYFELGMASTILCPSGSVQLYVDGNAAGSPVVLSGAGPCVQPVQLQTATLPQGLHNVYATYTGDTYYAGGPSGALPYTVTPDTTSVTLATSGTNANVGQPLTFTATVTPASLDASALPPTGYVQFVDGANQIGSNVPLSGNTASYTTSALAFGTHSISATFVDTDGNFVGNSSAVAVETVNLIVPTIHFAPTPTEFVYGTPLDVNTQLNATAVDPTSNLAVPGSFSYNFAANAVVPVGTPNLIATFAPADPNTYAANSATVSITVDPAVLTVTPDHYSINYGTAIPTLTYQIAGYINNDSPTVVSGTASCTTSATATSTVASYPITCTQGLPILSANNYRFQFVAGTLTVTQATPTITTLPTASTIIYGQTLASSALTGGAGSAAGSFAFTTPATLPGAGTASQSVTFTPADAVDYTTATGSVSVTVNKATSTVTTLPTASTITYGQTLASSTLTGGAGSTAGSFAFTNQATAPGAGTASQNVTFTPTDVADYTTATGAVSVTVNRGNASVTPNTGSKIYGSTDPAFTGTLTGFVAGDNVTAIYSRVSGETVAGGPYAISANLSPSGILANYNVTYNAANFTISKAPLTATANNASMSYDGTLPTLTGTLTGVISGDAITSRFTTTATAASPAGTYPITPQLSDPGNKLNNYATVLVNGTLTVSTDATTTTVQSSAPIALTQSNVTFTAKVSSSAGTPAGQVSFMDGSIGLGTVTLDNTGTATLTTSTLSVGSHNITAVYAGNVDYVGSASSAVTETVEDFSFSVNGSTTTVLSASVLPGNSAVYTLQLAPMSGATFASAVALTLAGLPAGATYTISPSTIPAGSGAATVTITVNTAKTQASATAPTGGSGFPKPLLLAIFLPVFGMRRLRHAIRLQMMPSMLILLGVLMATGMTACGGTSLPPPQTSAMTLTATSGAVHHSVTLNLTIQ